MSRCEFQWKTQRVLLSGALYFQVSYTGCQAAAQNCTLRHRNPYAAEDHSIAGFGVSQPVLFIPHPGWLPTRLVSSCLHLAIGILWASSLLSQEGLATYLFSFCDVRVSFPLKRTLRAVGLDLWILDSSEHHSVAILQFSLKPIMKGMHWLKVSS